MAHRPPYHRTPIHFGLCLVSAPIIFYIHVDQKAALGAGLGQVAATQYVWNSNYDNWENI